MWEWYLHVTLSTVSTVNMNHVTRLPECSTHSIKSSVAAICPTKLDIHKLYVTHTEGIFRSYMYFKKVCLSLYTEKMCVYWAVREMLVTFIVVFKPGNLQSSKFF